MVSSDSDNDEYDDLEFEGASDGDDNIDEDILGALEEDLAAAAAAEGTEGEEVRRHCCSSCSSLTTTQDTDSTTSYGGSDDDDGEEEHLPPHRDLEQMLTQTLQETTLPSKPPSPATESPLSVQGMFLRCRAVWGLTYYAVPQPPAQIRPPSPAQIRKTKILSDISWPRSFTVEAICAIPHPCATHALASSFCMTHFITGSDDGYIRDYDVFAAVNGKVFLTAPQRQHCGVIEGIMKAGHIRCWWENTAPVLNPDGTVAESPLYPVYSLAMQSDALWSLAGSDVSSPSVVRDPHTYERG